MKIRDPGRQEKKQTRWVLASASPRRKELLSKAGFTFSVVPSLVPEKPRRSESPFRLVKRLSVLKAESVAKKFTGCQSTHIVIAADTVVVLKKRIFGKPKSRNHAVRMLLELSGKIHRVYTGIAVTNARTGRTRWSVDFSKVKVKKFSKKFAFKIASKHMDKSGSYACQDPKDNIVEKIDGNWETVVGLPLKAVLKLTKGWRDS